MNVESIQTDRHIDYLEKFINMHYCDESLLYKDELENAQLMLEAYNLARLRGYDGEVAVTSHFINTCVTLRNNVIVVDTKNVDMNVLRRYIEKYNVNLITKRILLGEEDTSSESVNQPRTIGFNSQF